MSSPKPPCKEKSKRKASENVDKAPSKKKWKKMAHVPKWNMYDRKYDVIVDGIRFVQDKTVDGVQ